MVQERIQIQVSSRGARTVSRNIRNIGTSAKGAQGSVQLLSRALGLLGGALALTGAVRTMADFAQAMSTVKAVSGATTAQFIEMNEAAQQLGATTRFTATQAADGMTFLARAGFDANEVLQAIPHTLNLAQAGALELARAADIASNVIKGFGLEADSTERIVDILANTANSANTDVEQLGQAMSFAAPAAKAIGVEAELAAASVGVLSDAGVQATRAGTGLRQIFIQLISPTAKARKVIEKMGLNVSDLNVKSKGLIPVIELLREKNIGLADAAALVGVRQATSLLILKDNVARLKELNQENINAAGTAKKVAAVMDDNLNGALLRVKSAFESVTLSLGQAGGENSLRVIFERLATLLRIIASNADILATALAALSAVITVKLVQGALVLLLSSLKKLGAAMFALSARTLPLLASAAIASFSIMAAVAAANGKSIEETFNELKTSIVGVFEEIANPIGKVQEFGNAMANLSAEVEKLGGFSNMTKEQLTDFGDRIKKLKGEISQRLLIQEFISPGSEAVTKMTAQVETLNKVLSFLKGVTKEPLKINIAPKPGEIAKTADELRDLRLAFLETQTDLSSGFERGLLKTAKDFDDFATLAETSVTNAFQGMEDALVKFVQTGKLDFKSLADSIISDLIRIQIRTAITGPLSNMLSNFFSPSAGSGIAAITPGASAVGAGTPFATGGMVSGPGGPTDDLVNARLSNGEFVVNAMSASKFLPLLQAINDNSLGSSAPPASMSRSGGGGGGGGGVVVQVFDQRSDGDAEPVGVEEGVTGDGRKQITIMIRDTVKRQIAGGQFDGAMKNRFGSKATLVRRT